MRINATPYPPHVQVRFAIYFGVFLVCLVAAALNAGSLDFRTGMTIGAAAAVALRSTGRVLLGEWDTP